MLVIDGGFSKAYQNYRYCWLYIIIQFGMQLVAHQEFNTKDKVLSDGADELSVRRVVDEELQRKNT